MVRLPRAADHRHRALPPRRGRAQVRRLAQQHVLAARARRDPRRRPRGAGLRPAAAGAAAAAGDLGQLAVPRRPRLRPAQRAHADLHQELSALRRARRVRRAGRRSPTTSTSSSRTRSIVEYTQVWWSVRPHLAFGTVEVRICDAQIDRRRVRGAGGADRRLRRPGRPRHRRGRPVADLPRRLIEENMWRAIRYGLDGELLDLDARRAVPGRGGDRAAAELDRRRSARELGLEVALPVAQRRPAPARACSRRGMSLREVYAAVVAETRATYAASVASTAEVKLMSSETDAGNRPRRSCAPPTRRRSSGSASSTCARERRDAGQPRDAAHRPGAGHRGRARPRQVRLAIEAVRALLPLLEQVAPEQVGADPRRAVAAAARVRADRRRARAAPGGRATAPGRAGAAASRRRRRRPPRRSPRRKPGRARARRSAAAGSGSRASSDVAVNGQTRSASADVPLAAR